jgi:hypothetical protein
MLTLLKQNHLKISFFFVVVSLIYCFVGAFSQSGYDNQHYNYSMSLNESDDSHLVCPSTFVKNLPVGLIMPDHNSPAFYLDVSYFLEAKETLHKILFFDSKSTYRAPPLSYSS